MANKTLKCELKFVEYRQESHPVYSGFRAVAYECLSTNTKFENGMGEVELNWKNIPVGIDFSKPMTLTIDFAQEEKKYPRCQSVYAYSIGGVHQCAKREHELGDHQAANGQAWPKSQEFKLKKEIKE